MNTYGSLLLCLEAGICIIGSHDMISPDLVVVSGGIFMYWNTPSSGYSWLLTVLDDCSHLKE